MEKPTRELVNGFLEWFQDHPHSAQEDHYAGTLTLENLSQMDRQQFIEFFYQFAYDGGHVQSGGPRTAARFRTTIEAKYDEFRAFVLEPFTQPFNEIEWFQRTHIFSHFGVGLATIFLNRVNKKLFAIINNKAVEAVELLDMPVPSVPEQRYQAVLDAWRQLIEWYPEFENFYRADALSQFLIGEELGRPWADQLRAGRARTGKPPMSNTESENRWDQFIEWARRFYEWEEFDAQERDYKLEIAGNIRKVRASIFNREDAKTMPEWPLFLEHLKKAFAPPNNLTPWRVHSRFLTLAEEDPHQIASMLMSFWDDESDALAKCQYFIESMSNSDISMSEVLASFLLMGEDPHNSPIYRAAPYNKAYQLLGFDRPDTPFLRYKGSLDFLDTFLLEAESRGLKLRDRLDGQSLVWCITKWDPLDDWDQATKDAFLAYRDNGPTLTETVPPEKPPVDATWTSEAFTLLEQLHLNPTAEFYSTHAEEFKQRLEQPFQQLLGAVAQRLRPEITELMETEKRIFSRIVKNDYGRGGAWDFYWGAFYPRGSKRTESAQLLLLMREDYLDFGFYIGEYGSEQRSRFTKNCSLHLEILENILREPLSRDDLVFGETAATGDYRSKPVPGLKGNEWLNQIEQARIRAGVRLSRNEVQVMSDDTLAKNIADVFHDLFPLVLLATKDDPLTEIRRYVGEIPIDDETLNPEYSLEQCAAETHFDLEVLQRWVRAVERKKQAIFYGPPGTGKTFVAERLALHMIGEGDGFTEIVQFHPSYAYEDFMQGLRPRALSGGGLEYVMTPGRFKDFCDRARECKGPCVLIIDEINRANLSRVLGELMFLLEYRDQSVPLSGGERFQIPQNVRIIGTMNTADRSIALVDHALRRRFAFLELRPDYEVLRRYHADTGFDPEGLINLLQRLNAAIDDRHYSVGISFFLSPSIEEDIADIWQMELEPYIEELFFDQPDKAAGFEWDKVKAEIVG